MKNLSIIYFATLLLILFINPCFAQEEEVYKTLEVGSQAPNFNLPGIDGKKYTLKSFDKAKVLAIIFTCNHCPAAQAYEDRIKALVTAYRDKGATIIAINPNDPEALRLDELGYTDLNDSFEEMKIRAKDKQFNFIYLDDSATQGTSKAYGAYSTPHSFVLNKDRKVIYTGRIDGNESGGNSEDIKAAIDAGLADKMPAVTKTKTFGCTVKWSSKRADAKASLEKWAKEPVTLEDIDENGLKELLKNPTKKIRLINVWATWCGPCMVEFPDFVMVNRMFRHRDFEFISISADKLNKKDKALEALKKFEASNKNYIFTLDDKYKLIEAIDPQWQGTLPYTLIVEPGGKIVYRVQGSIDLGKLRKAIVNNQYIGRAFQ
ncbi:redoxin [Mucilaginibacter hurinus]|uniref:Redoxin n=1 Tax=Mucilaginibacter hurinus TaxID=2201324 RepID=A0A367GT47_9SPHI|nr:redoxin domain-containing protein [Mucilaginibacter hurinus]RCH56016.1 redoxin [Mucilaginibacter hurinus]